MPFKPSDWEEDNEPMQIVFEKSPQRRRGRIAQATEAQLALAAGVLLLLVLILWGIRGRGR